MTQRLSQPSHQKPVVEMRLSRKDLWRTLLSNEVDPCEIYRKLTRFLRIFYQQIYCQLELKGINIGRSESAKMDFQN